MIPSRARTLQMYCDPARHREVSALRKLSLLSYESETQTCLMRMELALVHPERHYCLFVAFAWHVSRALV